MKKINYFSLQFILSLILIVIGGLIEWKGKNAVNGIPYILFVIPGSIILLSYFIDYIKLCKHYYYLLTYVGLCLIADIIVFIKFKLPVNATVIFLTIGTIALGCGIAYIFHFIYDNLKHPNRLIRF